MTTYAPVGLRTATGQPTSRRVDIIHEVRQMMLILGVPIDNVTLDDALDRIERLVRKGREEQSTYQVTTINSQSLVKSSTDTQLRQLLQSSALCMADGASILWGARLLGVPLKGQIATSDIVYKLAERAVMRDFSLYLLGDGPDVVANIQAQLQTQFPTLSIAGAAYSAWGLNPAADTVVIEQIRAARPDILLVTFEGSKLAEWTAAYASQTGVPVTMGVGKSLKHLAANVTTEHQAVSTTGSARRQPFNSRKVGRAKSFSADFLRLTPRLLQQWWTLRKRNPHNAHQPLTIETRSIGETSILNLKGALTHRSANRLMHQGKRALSRRANLTINLAQLTALDCVAVGTLMQLKHSAEIQSGQFRLVGIRKPLRRQFDQLNVSPYFDLSQTNMMLGYRS